MMKYHFLALIFFIASITVQAQDYNFPSTGNVKVSTSTGQLILDGYTNNQYSSITIFPLDTTKKITLTFSANNFSIENYDKLIIYDDSIPNNDRIIGEYNDNKKPGVISATNHAGSLTLLIDSDDTVSYAGFTALISSTTLPTIDISPKIINITPQQIRHRIISLIISTNTSHIADSVDAGFYLSGDSILDNTDLLINLGKLNLFNGNNIVLHLPDTLTPGDYNLICILDSANIFNESNENNNLTIKRIKVYPYTQLRNGSNFDLEFGQLINSRFPFYSCSPYKFIIGNKLEYFGTLRFWDWYYGYYSDLPKTKIGLFIKGPSMPDGVKMSETFATPDRNPIGGELILPDTLIPGTYVLYFSDYEGTYGYKGELFPSQITVLSKQASLLFEITMLDTITKNPGAEIQIKFKAINIGSVTSDTFSTKFYLSSDLNYDNSDLLLLSETIPRIRANSIYTFSTGLLTPDTLSAGKHYIIAVPDTNFGLDCIDAVPLVKEFKVGTITLSKNGNTNNSSLKIFPNPCKDFIQIDFLESIESYEFALYSSIGNHLPIRLTRSSQNSVIINLTDLTPGLYMIKTLKDGTHSTGFFIKE